MTTPTEGNDMNSTHTPLTPPTSFERGMAHVEAEIGPLDPSPRNTHAQQQAHTSQTIQTCDICGQRIQAGEKFHDDGAEIAHTACVAGWFSRNYGREGLS